MNDTVAALSHMIIILSLIFVVYRQGQIRKNGKRPHDKNDFPPL